MADILQPELWDEMKRAAQAAPSSVRLEETNLGLAFRILDGRRTVGPLVFPGPGQTVGETLDMLLGTAPWNELPAEPEHDRDPRWAYQLTKEQAYRAWPCVSCGVRRGEHFDQDMDSIVKENPSLRVDHPFVEES